MGRWREATTWSAPSIPHLKKLALLAADTIAELRRERDEARAECARLATQDEPTFTYTFKVRAEAAERALAEARAECQLWKEGLADLRRALAEARAELARWQSSGGD